MVILVSSTGSPPLNAGLRNGLQLRAMRSSPPGLAGSGERRKVFSAALEQSEQLLSAAALTPPSARPMLVFYGLAQGCRALFACAPTIPRDNFRTRGHGLRERRLKGSLQKVAVEADGTGMFGALCQLMDFTKFTTAVTFGQLWASNPDLFQRRLAESVDPPCVTANCMLDSTALSNFGLLSLGFFSAELRDRLSSDAQIVDYVRSNYGPFPFNIVELDPRSHYKACSVRETWLDLNVHIPRADFETAAEHIEERRATIGYNSWMLPRIGDVISKPNALVLWYALFFSLSIRARYEPEGWTRDVDPDTSPIAVQLEDLLDDAPSRCQGLLLDAIKTVCV